jgi:hypothetical protein
MIRVGMPLSRSPRIWMTRSTRVAAVGAVPVVQAPWLYQPLLLVVAQRSGLRPPLIVHVRSRCRPIARRRATPSA